MSKKRKYILIFIILISIVVAFLIIFLLQGNRINYLTDSDFCSKDKDCVILDNGCGCSNFIWKNLKVPGAVEEVCNPDILSCDCINNRCNEERIYND